MTNQNSKCPRCGGIIKIHTFGSSKLGNHFYEECVTCHIRRNYIDPTSHPTTSKDEEKTGKGLVKCDRCRQIKPIGLVLENITDVNCGKGLCIDCSKDAYDFTHMRSSPTRLENWEERWNKLVSKLDGLATNLDVRFLMEKLLEHRAELKSFISTLLQEERWKESKRCMDIFMNYTDPDTTMAVGKKIFNLQQQ